MDPKDSVIMRLNCTSEEVWDLGLIPVTKLGGFQKNEVFFNIKAELISFTHIRSHLYLKCVL